MSNDIRIRVGGSAWDDGAAFLAAIHRSEEGEAAIHRSEEGEAVSQRILSFESLEGLTALVTKARLGLLRHLHAHEAVSVNKLAAALGRPYRRVHDDVVALERAGLIERAADNHIRALVDGITAEVRFDRPRAVAVPA